MLEFVMNSDRQLGSMALRQSVYFSKYLVMALLTVSAVHHLHAIYFNVHYLDLWKGTDYYNKITCTWLPGDKKQ